eukprot:5753747-Karenia_brevis.AAC.1
MLAAIAAAAGLAKGAVRGALEASASSQTTLPAPPPTAVDDQEVEPRSLFEKPLEKVPQEKGHCQLCWAPH